MLTNEQKHGIRATIKAYPNPARRWRESILVAALDAIDFEQSRIAALEAEVERLRRIEKIAVEALNISACWSDGQEVDSSFDSPGDAAIARSALKQIKEIINAS